jgi:hypothetical protein
VRPRAATRARALALGVACAWAIAGCDGAFHFGNGIAGSDGGAGGVTDDAGPGYDDLASDGPCSALTCPWDQTCATTCALSCPAGQTCIGSCGGSCNATCAAGATCTLVAGSRSTVTCQGSACQITIGEGGSATCQQGAHCAVVCTDDCSLTCAADSQCTLQCPGHPTPASVSGNQTCVDPL